jgi:hypothetical protein
MISINRCRNTVLYLLEKNNRGFITPMAFDAFCNLAQMELFENLFYQYNKGVLDQTKHLTNTGYGDIPKNIQEQIDSFSEYSLPTNFSYSTANDLYTYTGTDLYRTIGISLLNAQGKKTDIEETSKGYELNNLINSKINAPTVTYPIYVKIGKSFKVYPKAPAGYKVELLYIRTPKAPKWTYTTDAQGNPQFSGGAADRQDIELDESMFAPFIMKVMAFCGVSIKEQDIVAVAANAEQVTEQKKS